MNFLQYFQFSVHLIISIQPHIVFLKIQSIHVTIKFLHNVLFSIMHSIVLIRVLEIVTHSDGRQQLIAIMVCSSYSLKSNKLTTVTRLEIVATTCMFCYKCTNIARILSEILSTHIKRNELLT